jgi:hypothetical protein
MKKASANAKVKLSSKANIMHDDSGNIISVGRVPANSRGRVEVKPRNKAHSVLEVELNAEQASMSVSKLHKEHKVHVGQKKLVKR